MREEEKNKEECGPKQDGPILIIIVYYKAEVRIQDGRKEERGTSRTRRRIQETVEALHHGELKMMIGEKVMVRERKKERGEGY
ncbi:hypothetical protein ANTPLA_LOCUS8131 [Anthophora plagiata]